VPTVDKAHLLDADQLEELRLLTNADMDATSPFSLILAGQPTLRQRIKLGAFAALDQRIALRCTLGGVTPAKTGDYIATTSASPAEPTGSSPTTPSPLIHQVARGLPRAANNLAIQVPHRRLRRPQEHRPR
jgi:type II secretory pathway predicted ATPase ExeA